MKLYSGPLSAFARKVEIALDEKGLQYERIEVEFTQERGYNPKHPDVAANNPKGQVPVLMDGEVTLFDSTVIFEYLEDAYPQPALFPKGAAARAACRLLDLKADEIMFPQAFTLGYKTEPMPADPARRQALLDKAAQGEAALRGHFEALDRLLEGRDFLLGALSYADIATFMPVFWSQRLKGPSVASYRNLGAWYGRVKARPSFARASGGILAADERLTPELKKY